MSAKTFLYFMILSCYGNAFAAQDDANYHIQTNALKLDIYISRTAHLFHAVDQISQWSEFCHRQYVSYFEGMEGGISKEDRELLSQHCEIRRVHGWGQGLEQTFYTPLGLDSAIELAVKEGRLTEKEAKTEQGVLIHFKERVEHLISQETPTLNKFVQELRAQEPNLTAFADVALRFVGGGKLTVPVYLLANPHDIDHGGGFNGGRLPLEIARKYDMYPTLLHELFHAFLETKQESIDKAARTVSGLDSQTLSEGLAYAYSPGIIHPGDSDELLLAAVDFMSKGSPMSDSYTRFKLYGLALRPLLKDALYGRRQTLNDFLPRATDAWLVLNELDKARGVKGNAQINDYQKDPKHSIFVFGSCDRESWRLLRNSAAGHIFGRRHISNEYEEMLTKNSKPGDQIILLLSLDNDERVPQQFSDLMPLPWPQVEARLKNDRFIFEQCFSRKMTVFLIAAPTAQEMNTAFQRFIAEKKFGSEKGKTE